MDNWAIVIGINEYWKPEFCLKGAVHDAEEMCKWLLRKDGGGVAPRNLYLLLSPAPSSSSIPGVKPLPATSAVIKTTINRLIDRSGGQGDRFFFYYSGHGISVRENFVLVNALVPSDFSRDLPDNAIALNAIYDRFQATGFREQFFFIDGCRNLPPFDFPYAVGKLGLTGEQKPPLPPEFIMYATSSGREAAEVDERSAFTSALLEGLAGKGLSKVFDDNEQDYVVTWDNLFRYVEAEVKARKIPVGGEFVQEPKRDIREQGAEKLVMARFPPKSFEPETLEINLLPGEAAPTAMVVLDNYRDGEVARQTPPMRLPIQISLPPQTYRLRWAAPNYKPTRRYQLVDLYKKESVILEFLPEEPSLDLTTEKVKMVDLLDGLLFLNLGDDPTPGEIELRSADPLAHLILLDNSAKNVLARGYGRLLTNMAPGFYRARLITPENQYSEEHFALAPGGKESISLKAPSPPETRLFKDVTEKGAMTPEPDNTIEPSEAMGPITTAHLSTILALAGGAVNEIDTYRGHKLRQIGLSSFQQIAGPATSGVQILFGVEAGNVEETQSYLSQIRVACWRQDSFRDLDHEEPISPLPTPGLAEFAFPRYPGPHWLSVRIPDQSVVAFSIAVLPFRLTLLVFVRNESGDFRIFQYLPALTPGDPRDWRGDSGARFPILQRSELIQRSYLSARLQEPDRNTEELFYGQWVEPIAGALSGLALLKVNPGHYLLDSAIRNMMKQSDKLSDSHVLEGAYREITMPDSPTFAHQSYLQALGTGFPVLAEGLERLVKGLERLPSEYHTNWASRIDSFRRIREKQVPGLMWTAVPAEDLNNFSIIQGWVT